MEVEDKGDEVHISINSVNKSLCLKSNHLGSQLETYIFIQFMECGGVCVVSVLVRSLKLSTHSSSCKNGWVTIHFLLQRFQG